MCSMIGGPPSDQPVMRVLMKRLLNKVRYQRHFSLAARYFSLPVESFCQFIANQLRMKVWVNGGAVNYHGIKLIFPPNVGVGFATGIFWNGINGFEPDTWRVIKYFLSRSSLFVDVGSNIGLYSVMARKVYPDLRVLSYEPVPSVFKNNVKFHEVNGCSVENLFNVAIGDIEGEAKLFLPKVQGGIEEETTATLRKDSWQRTKTCETYDVKVITLDHVLQKLSANERILIKIDVEDFEACVLKGAEALLKYARPIIVCEILPRDHGNAETYEIISSNGFVAFAITSTGLFRFGGEDFLAKRSFRDFLIVHDSIAPRVNYLHHSSLVTMVESWTG